MRMTLCNETKSIPVSKAMIWHAYKRVRANKGSAGVDAISIEQFDADLSRNLYKLWNRMASGSYFPPPVKYAELNSSGASPGRIKNNNFNEVLEN